MTRGRPSSSVISVRGHEGRQAPSCIAHPFLSCFFPVDGVGEAVGFRDPVNRDGFCINPTTVLRVAERVYPAAVGFQINEFPVVLDVEIDIACCHAGLTRAVTGTRELGIQST